MKNENEEALREEANKVPSEKSYDSESEINMSLIDEEEARAEEENRLQAEKFFGGEAHEKNKEGAGGVEPSFLDELINQNAEEVEEERKKEEEVKSGDKAAENADLIQLVEESEHLFIKYAQQKLADNKVLLDERASKALEGLKRKELTQQRVLSEVRPRNYGIQEA